MKQFTVQQTESIRLRLERQPEIMARLITDNADVLAHPVLIPQTGIATWNHYYYCPDHGVRLQWDRQSPTAHVCPVDGEVFRGEPYDGAWWRWLNGLNAKACYQLGLAWMLTRKPVYLQKVSEILLGYARYYPDYQVHGDIPYNGPGKANAQTLCEANCMLDFARGYDFIADALSEPQRQTIEQRLLREGAEFLMQHRHAQLHNHEVKISSTIGVIGLILDEPRYLDFAVNAPYGLRYQLEHGRLPGGLWFEGSLHYHFYALEGFFDFEKLARGTDYSLMNLPWYRQMLSLPLALLMPDGTLPRLNDCVYGQETLSQHGLYEFAWQQWLQPEYADALRLIYQRKPRASLEALLYGADTLAQANVTLPQQHYHDAQVGLTIMRQPSSGRSLLVKHTPYGGEHDHYDRLGIILFSHGKERLPDLGTTGYGAPLHYGYYKNSATHNTLTLEQQNQPPATPRVNQWRSTAESAWLDCEVDWCRPGEVPDSLIIQAWDDELWRGAAFRRQVLMEEGILIDLCRVENPQRRQAMLVAHLAGEILSAGECATTVDFTGGPLSHMHDITGIPLPLVEPLRCAFPDGETIGLLVAGNGALVKGKAPDNPATSSLDYLLFHSQEPQIVCCTLYDFATQDPVQSLTIQEEEEGIRVEFHRRSASFTRMFPHARLSAE